MRKVTIEFNEIDVVVEAIDSAKQVIKDNALRLKHGNIKVVFDEGFKKGVITQKGVRVAFMQKAK